VAVVSASAGAAGVSRIAAAAAARTVRRMVTPHFGGCLR
jgi:hypothetical protein